MFLTFINFVSRSLSNLFYRGPFLDLNKQPIERAFGEYKNTRILLSGLISSIHSSNKVYKTLDEWKRNHGSECRTHSESLKLIIRLSDVYCVSKYWNPYHQRLKIWETITQYTVLHLCIHQSSTYHCKEETWQGSPNYVIKLILWKRKSLLIMIFVWVNFI